MYNNNYGYNPYYQQRYAGMLQQGLDQQMQPLITNPINNVRQMLNGKIVDSLEVVKATDIPLDGSVSYYPLADNSMIVTKQLQNDGTTKITIYKPVEEKQTEIKYVTSDELEKAISNVDLTEIEDIKDEFREIKREIKEIQKKLKNKGDS